MEDNFPMHWWEVGDGFRMIQAHYIQAHLLLGGLVPNGHRPVPVHGLEVGDPCFKHTLMHMIVPHRSLKFCSFFFILFLRQDNLNFTVSLPSPLILSSVCSNALFLSSRIFTYFTFQLQNFYLVLFL